MSSQNTTTSKDQFLESLESLAPLIVAEYAKAKNLPEEYLRDVWGVVDSDEGIIIPYRNTDGSLFREKLRRSLSHDIEPFMKWCGKSPADQKTIPYGLNLIPKNTTEFLLVEGESDTQTAHYRGWPAVGISGSNGWSDEFATLPAFADANFIFVVKEPGAGGEEFVARLARSPIREKFRVITTLPTKDFSELHLRNLHKGVFDGFICKAKDESKPIPVPPVKTKPEVIDDSTKVARYAKALEGYLGEAGIKAKREDYYGGYKWILPHCPFNRDHGGTSAALFVRADAMLGFKCQHKSCAENRWKQFRAHLEERFGKPLVFEEPKSEPDVRYAAAATHAEISEPESSRDNTHAATVVATPVVEDVPVADAGIKDMPESVLDGWLGDVCKKRMLEHFPVAYAWTALVTVASAMVPVDVAKNGMRCNLFGCPVGPIHSGKSEAIKHAKLLLGIQSPPLLDLMAGSAEMLTSAVEDAGRRPRLYSTDELGHLLEKAQIQNSSFVYLLNRAFYETGFKVRSMEKKKKEVVFNATLSVIGGVVEERFGDLFTSKTTGGFYDRFLFGLCPTGFRYFYMPFEGGPALQINPMEGDLYGEEIVPILAVGNQPIPVSLDKSVFCEANRWMRDDDVLKNPDCERIVEIAMRVATVCASFDRRPVLYGKDLAPALELARYQARIRHLLKPNPGKTFEGQLYHKFFEFLTMHTSNGEWMTRKELFHRTCSHEIGLPVANKTLDAMIANDDVEELKTVGKHGGPPKRFVRIVRNSKVQP